jgi:dihydrodipicolinate synthase/N-acetylneuraminate lyase
MPLALRSNRKLDERRQRALCRYYAAAGAGGIAVGVHTTQFEIRDPKHGLHEPVLALVADELDRQDGSTQTPKVRVAGICGSTTVAVHEARLAHDLGYHLGLLSLGNLADADENALITHCRVVAEVLPLFGFYLQPAVGGRYLSYAFWRRFCEIPQVVAIKLAPFNRYRTIDVVRAVADSGREDIALYTGNDDSIITDLITPFRFDLQGAFVERRIVGGLLGHWSVWTQRAVELLAECHHTTRTEKAIPHELMRRAAEVTDANAALFDAAHDFHGCLVGLHEILRRQGILEGVWTLDPRVGLSHEQDQEIDRVCRAYPHLNDDEFVAEHRDKWLRN